MSDLWAGQREARRRAAEPLAHRMRPRTLEQFLGQQHFLGPGKLLRRMLDADRLTSIICCGPPGTGKTTLAEVIARDRKDHFEHANAALIGVREVRAVIDGARRRLEDDERRTVLFLDEIHRFARNQQDVLLDSVETGVLILIGATTENPFFTVNSALVSRSTVLRFEPLDAADIETIVRRAITEERGLGRLPIEVSDEAIAHWALMSDGDARRALNALEVAALSQRRMADGGGPIVIDLACAEESIQAKALVYDGTGDQHYEVISAFIKSMRAGDTDGAVHWLARMLEAGEDPRFIARRIAIFASEDVGNADPDALQVAEAAWTLTERVGMPEARLILAQATTYMACAPKSRAATEAIEAAARDVREERTVAVPEHLINRARPGEGAPGNGGPPLTGRYYRPTNSGFEEQIRQRLEQHSDPDSQE